jgi:S1-C subfamily serine protease
MRVVIAPESAVTDAVRDCLLAWSRARLLAPFCLWVVPLGEPGAEPDQVLRIEKGKARSGTLAEALEGTPSDQVALVGFYAAGPDAGFDPRFAAAVERCIEVAKMVLAFEKGHPVDCTVMVVPEQIAQKVSPEVFCGTWNLYVAPEDRAAPAEANQLLHSTGLLPRHGAHALATIADLWANAAVQPTAALAAVSGREVFAIDPPAVRVVRCFSRVVDLGYISDHVAAGVFKAGSSWPNPDQNRFDRANDPSRVLAAATRGLVDVHRELIGLTEFQPLELPPEKRPKLLEALRELIQMIEARIRRLPSELADATLGKAHDHLATMIDRYRGEGMPATLRWRERPSEERSLTDLTDALAHPLPTPDGPTGAVWRDLRQTSLGLIDGSSLPEALDEQPFIQRGKRILVTKPDAIVPDPELAVPRQAAERPCDPLALDPRFTTEERGEEGEDEAAAELRHELNEWLAKPRQTLVWQFGVEIATALEVAREAAAELEAEAAVQVAQEAEQEKEAAGEGVKTDAGSGEEQAGSTPKRRWRGFRNTLLGYGVLAVIASVLAWSRLDLLPAAGAQVVVLVAWTAAVLRSILGFVHLERRIMREEISAQLDVVNRATLRALRAGDLPRLERRYGEYLDWAEIIGWMAHHPWVGEPIGRVELEAPVERTTLPAAFRLAPARVPPEFLERLSRQARANVFDTGWLLDQYRGSLEENGRRMSMSRSYSGQGGSLDPDADVLDDPDSPRRVLRDAVRLGEGRHLKDNEMTEAVLRFIEQLPLDATSAGVVGSLRLAPEPGAEAQALPPCPAWFAPPPHFDELVPKIRAGVARISASTSFGLKVGLGAVLGEDGLIVTSHGVVASSTRIQVQLAGGARCEATVLRTLPDRDLALLQVEEMPGEFGGTVEFGAREPRLGEPILTPGPPDRDPDQPEVALGLIVRQGDGEAAGGGGFGATYRSLAGPAGAPVFDLHGHLIGVHRSPGSLAGVDADLIRPVVEADAVRELLERDGDADADTAVVFDEDRSPATNGTVQRPTDFLSALFAADPDPMGFLPQHWTDADDQHFPELTLGAGGFEFVRLDGLVAAVEFLRPVRLIVHRVDVTAPLAARELASCATQPLV